MKAFQTTGQEFYKGLIVKIFYSDNIFLGGEKDIDLYQIVYVEEGSVIIRNNGDERTILAPVVFCLNYQEKNDKIIFSNVRGFTIFFKPEAINHGLLGAEVSGVKSSKEDYFSTEQHLIQPFKDSTADAPIIMSVNGMMRDRLLRIASNIKTQLCLQPDTYWPCRGRSFFLEFLMLIESMSKIESANAIELDASNKTVEPFIRTIHILYNEPDFSVKQMPLPKGFGKLRVYSSFKKATGKSMTQYLVHLRCTVAENLLKNTLLPVDEIARRCGYKKEAKFVSDFRHMRNVAPLAWRACFPDPYG
jgi:hypothetical protein